MDATNHAIRPEFIPPQLVQAEHIGHVSDRHRAERRVVRTHPIDNVEPEVAADRDDGIFVEAAQQGEGYRVHVTIADVAAHVRFFSPLGTAARDRAFTVYGPGWTDPMFPKILEDRMSLEHQQERLGLTVTMDLDANFKPIHTEMEPVITRAENASYSQAQHRMENDPQYQLMRKIADGVQQNYFSPGGAVWDELMNQRGVRASQMATQEEAMKMVATYMLLANSSVAKFFAKTDLPFLYRNFDEASERPRAYYSSAAERHTALERSGLKGAYCHVTSPIRRVADFVNGHTMHYAIGVLQEAEQALAKLCPTCDSKKLHHALWESGPELLGLLQQTKTAHYKPKLALEKKLSAIMESTLSHAQSFDAKALRRVAVELQRHRLPYDAALLNGSAEHINALSQSGEMRRIAKLSDKFDRGLERLDQFENDAAFFHGANQFSSLLHAAATTGELSPALYAETLKRIEDGNFDAVLDGFHVLVLADYPTVPAWLELKKAVSLLVKHDPTAVNGLIDRLKLHVAPSTLHEHEASLPIEGDRPPTEAQHMHSAILVMQGAGDPTVAPPFYSIGHNSRAAKSHARYSFLEHYAFGQLRPLTQANVPNLLYAELNMPERERQGVVETMAHALGADLKVDVLRTERGYLASAKVSGGQLSAPIITMAEDEKPLVAKQIALRRLLREPNFKYAVSRSSDNMDYMINPQTVLEDVARRLHGQVEFPRPLPLGRGKIMYKAEALVTIGDRRETYSGTGPNMDRATRAACVEALEALGWPITEPQVKAQSWVSDLARRPSEFSVGK